MTKRILDLEKTYLQERKIKRNYIIPKYSSEEGGLKNATDYKFFIRAITQNNQPISFDELRKVCNVVFVFQDVVYKSDFFNFKLLNSFQLKSIFQVYSKDRFEINRFIEDGLFVIDINDFNNENFVWMDRKNHIITCVDKNTFKLKFENPIKKFVDLDLDEDYDITDELYLQFFGDNISNETDPTHFDEQYFEYDEEYSELYDY